MLAQVLRGNIYQDGEIRGEGSSVKGGEGWREGGGIVDQLEETGDFFGTGRTKLARGCCSRLNPSLTDRLELTFLNDAPPKRGVLLRATMDPAIEEFLKIFRHYKYSKRQERKV